MSGREQEHAQTLALDALGWLMAHEELRPVFLGASGADAESLAGQAAEPDTLLGVLDFLTMDDEWIRSFCADCGYGPAEPLAARDILAGPAGAHWT